MKSTRMDRRSFLRTTSAAAAGISLPCLIPSHVLGGPDRPGANERVNVGIIGLGGRACQVANTCFHVPQMRIAAVCDCYLPRGNDFAKRVGKSQKWKVYEDFRQMIDKEKLDGVMVETTTHARAWIVVQAMHTGVDTYIEKPMCLTIAEGREMVNAARKFNRVTQVGTQQRSMPINNWASDLVKNGAMGKCLTVIAPNFVGPFRWTKTSSKDVKGPVDPWWDVWTNQAELRPYDADIHHGWGRWWDYDGGGLLLRRHRLGHPLLRPDQPRPGHRRHRPGRGAPGRAVRHARLGQVRRRRDRRRRDRRRYGRQSTPATAVSRHGQDRAVRGPR